MNLIDTSSLPLQDKTIAEWWQESRRLSHHFRSKYENSFNDKRYTISMMRFYRSASDTYFEIAEVLKHLHNYGSLIDVKCSSCKNDEGHKYRLENNFNKYYKFIVKCRDGHRYKKTMSSVLLHDI